jgi:hypothetical protein
MKATDRTFDYGKRYGVSATLIWGMAKTVFNGQSDFGVFTIETAAAPHYPKSRRGASAPHLERRISWLELQP